MTCWLHAHRVGGPDCQKEILCLELCPVTMSFVSVVRKGPTFFCSDQAEAERLAEFEAQLAAQVRFNELRGRVLELALDLVPEYGWSSEALAVACAKVSSSQNVGVRVWWCRRGSAQGRLLIAPFPPRAKGQWREALPLCPGVLRLPLRVPSIPQPAMQHTQSFPLPCSLQGAHHHR